MATRSRTICMACGTMYVPGRGCPTCSGKARKRYEAAPARREDKAFYDSPAWRAFRRAELAMRPLCVAILPDGRPCHKPAKHLHHIKPRKTHPELAFDGGNVDPLCVACHSRLEAKEKMGWGVR